MDAENLQAGESMSMGAGYPALTYFEASSNESNPLVVFIPGACHLGRIAYGTPESAPDDFLAHWIKKIEHPFLSISYPINHPVYKETYPEFSLKDWANQITEIITQTISANNLSKKVIMLFWSASGRVIPHFVSSQARSNTFDVKLAITLDATPPLYFLCEPFLNLMNMEPSGLCSFEEKVYPIWDKMLNEQASINDKESILSEKPLRKWVLGDIPIGIMSTSIKYSEGYFVNDISNASHNLFSAKNFPFLAVIQPNSKLDAGYAINSASNWQLYMDRQLHARFILDNYKHVEELEQARCKKIIDNVSNYLSDFTYKTPGNHYFFVGKRGGRIISDSIVKFQISLDKFKNKMNELCNDEDVMK